MTLPFLILIGGGHIEFVALAAIPEVKTPFILKRAAPLFRAEFLVRRRFQLAKFLLQFCLRQPIDQPPEQRTRVIFDHIADQDPERRKCARSRGNHHGRDRQRLRQFAGMKASRAAERHQRKFARIVPALDGDDAQGALHVGIHHAHDAGGKLFQAQARALFLQPFAT